jgi:hypothetical protein
MHPNGSSAMSLLAHFSNQLEALFDALCQQLRRRRPDRSTTRS